MGNVVQHNFSDWRVAVFGAGYVGSALARALAAANAEVHALTRNAASAEALKADGIRVRTGLLRERDWHAAFAGDYDLVVDCVGSGGAGIQGYRESYLEGMRSILDWCEGRTVGTLAYTSSTSVYAQGGGVRIDETFEASGRSPQAAVLVETENLLLKSTAPIRRRVVLRLAGIYGPGRHHLLDQVRSGLREIDGAEGQHLNLIHRDDVVGAILAAAASPKLPACSVFNLADDGESTRGEILRWLSRETGSAEPVFTGKPSPTGRAPVPDRVIVNGLVKRTLGWSPQYPTFRDGYRALLGSPR